MKEKQLPRDFTVKFWGVRGSIPVAGRSTLAYGGNTPCLEVRCGSRLLMLDAGSGALLFGDSLADQKTGKIDILYTHMHYDHIEGTAFFAPLYNRDWSVQFWSGHRHGIQTTHQMITDHMRQPYFPIGPATFAAQTQFHDFEPGSQLDLGDGIIAKTIKLNHPGGSTGYRIEFDGRSLCYITDLEHEVGQGNEVLEQFVSGADILIYDASYEDETFDQYRGFGHSTWQQGARLAQNTGVKKYVAFHHLPSADEKKLDTVAAALEAFLPGSVVAREGVTLVI